MLNFVEQNQYQSIIRLYLQLKKGNDENIKKYLATKLKETKENAANSEKQFKDEIESLKNKMYGLEDTLAKSKYDNEQLLIEVGQFREENKRIVGQLKMEEEKRLHELREKTLLE